MTEQDEELRKWLAKWEAPAPGTGLDERVWASFRRKPSASPKWWYRVAAGVILTALALHLLSNPSHKAKRGANLETRLNAEGFTPLSNGAITVLKHGTETKQ